MAALSDYLENAIIDAMFRAQPFAWPATLYIGLFTATPSDSGGGTEVNGGSYARVAVPCSLANWSGTQGAGTTTASTGTNGTTSNNGVITFPAPTADWNVIQGFGLFDAAVGGNMLIWGTLAVPKTVNNQDAAPSFPAAAFAFQIDN
jgi:hypothetical protein